MGSNACGFYWISAKSERFPAAFRASLFTKKRHLIKFAKTVPERFPAAFPLQNTFITSGRGARGLKLEDRMNRRSLLGSILLAVAARPLTWSLWISAALASDRNWRHGVSSFGDLKYSVGFRHFEYVNADAPKGGTARHIAYGTFDNFQHGESPALRARSPPASILSTRRFWYRRSTKYRPHMVCLLKW